MNKAKREAEELILMFLRKLPFDKEVITKNEHGKWTYDSEELAREHAIIHVTGIIEENGFFSYKISPLIVARRKFWKQVKQHLSK